MNQQQPAPAIVVAVHIGEPLLQAGACAALDREAGISVVQNAPGAIAEGADVVVVDDARAFALADGSARADYGPGLARARVLAIARSVPRGAVRCAMRQGVHGFVLSTSPLHELASGVRTLARGDKFLCQSLTWQMAVDPADDALTRRESEVLQLLAQGACNKVIARRLDIAVGTVKWHVRAIMMKLHASTRTEAASIALRRGLFDMTVPAPN
jgi:DNA-binding NarL/FixJ family response regulator